MAYYAYGCDEAQECATLSDALDFCRIVIDYAYDNCDPEWPLYVEDIHIKQGAPGLDDEAQDDLPTIYIATPVNITRPSSDLDEDGCDSNGDYWGNGCDFMCDYEMRPARRTGQGGGDA